MKNKKKVFLIGGIALAVVIAILCIVLIPNGSETADNKNSSVSSENNILINDPIKDTESQPGVTKESEITDDGTGLKPIVESEAVTTSKTDTNKNKKAADTAKPISSNNNNGKDNGTVGGITINGGDDQKYSCGVAGHHCDGPETHAYIQNLELKGCPYCGSHSCKSFYATDEWGNSCYTPSKCPKYDIKKDPVYYCQVCGKKCGDGKNGTCVQFINECICPNCGKHADARTCHSCK